MIDQEPNLDQAIEKGRAKLARSAPESSGDNLIFWVIRVGIVALILYAANHFWGPLWWTWIAFAVYAVLSLFLNLILRVVRNRQIEKLHNAVSEAEQLRDTLK